MRFDLSPELALFSDSVRRAVAGWEGTREPGPGGWHDDRDHALAARVAAVGWEALWESAELLGAAVAGGIELGRAAAPLCLVDEATLGAPLAVGDRVRHGAGTSRAALVTEGGLELARIEAPVREPTLDASGTVRGRLVGRRLEDGDARLRAWSAATLGYVAGLARASLDVAVAHAVARVQFGAPLAALPAVQQRLADAALAADGALLTAWAAAIPGGEPVPVASLLHAGGAGRVVTAASQQLHGASGFALESGLHRAYRRAKSCQVWAAAVCRAYAD
jgi:hypothetical protein